jgi:uncharacterized membrane protein YjgN (DUF898 family)
METVRSYYELLHIAPEASHAEIEQAYHRLVTYLGKKINNGTPPPPEEFERLDRAFSVLRDPGQRAAYDADLSAERQSSKSSHREADGSVPQGQAGDTPPAAPFTFAAAPSAKPQHLPFTFHGEGSEYFRIWIVNLLLSILTLGIYSAWAKVRREQYFHRNLVLDGAGFDYHGNPVSILKGRIIALIMFAAISVAQNTNLLLYLLALFVGALIFPWLMMRSMRFRASNSSYRGLRFAFVGTYGGAFKAFIAYGLLALITAGICIPLWVKETRKYMLDNLRYGHGAFNCAPSGSTIFVIMLKAFGMVMVAGLATGLFFALHKALGIVGMLLVTFAYLAIVPYVRMGIENHVWNRTTLDGNAFSSFMDFKRYFGIVLLNWLLIVLTLGLYWPWAKVKLVAYRASCTGLSVTGGLDHFMAVASEHNSALGDEAMDMFDFDIAI